MKRLLLLFCLGIFCYPLHGAAQLKSTTSEIFELSSIAFRLASAEEYMHCPIPSYVDDIDNYFASYSDHEFIRFIKQIRENYLIGYDAVGSAAANLVVIDGNIAISPDFDKSRISEIDARWEVGVYGKYVDLMNEFFKDTHFDKFYSDHRKLYDVATSRADKLLENIDIKWFGSFFGEELGQVRIVASLCSGQCNYAYPLLNKNNEFGIIIGCRADAKGLPVYSAWTPHTIIHELSHCFTNKLIEGIWDRIEPAALKIYPYVEQRLLKEGAIGFPTNMIYEWFTDLSTNMYFRENGAAKGIPLTLQIATQQNKGFIWMEKSVDFMNGFYENRDLYPCVKDYMPQIAMFINEIASDFDQVITDYENRNPRVVETLPGPESTVALDMDQIVIKFSEPMNTGLYGYGRTKEEGVLQVPALNGDKEFWQDDVTFVIPINNKKLIPNRRYGLSIKKYYFTSAKQYPLSEDFTLYFNTCAK